MADLDLRDGLVLLLATVLLITFFYAYNYYLKLRRQWRIKEAEFSRRNMLRPIGLPPFLVIGKSPLPALAIIVYLGIVSIVIFSTVWAGLFWLFVAAAVIWFHWIHPHLGSKRPGEPKETASQ
jgi:hypothetical protein